MQKLTEALQQRIQEQPDDALMKEALEALMHLQKKEGDLENVLIMLVRTGWPWDDEGSPNGILQSAGPGYESAIREARSLIGLEYRSRITRTEPRT